MHARREVFRPGSIDPRHREGSDAAAGKLLEISHGIGQLGLILNQFGSSLLVPGARYHHIGLRIDFIGRPALDQVEQALVFGDIVLRGGDAPTNADDLRKCRCCPDQDVLLGLTQCGLCCCHPGGRRIDIGGQASPGPQGLLEPHRRVALATVLSGG